MKLCYDSDIYFKNGSFYLLSYAWKLHYYESCELCEEEFVSKCKNVRFCSKKCSSSGKNNGMYGKHFPEEKKPAMSQKLSKLHSGINNPMYGKSGVLSPTYGMKHTKESKLKISIGVRKKISEDPDFNKDFVKNVHSVEAREKRSKTLSERSRKYPELNPWFIDGRSIFALYDTYAPQLEPYEKCRRSKKNTNIIEVKCSYCGKWYEEKPSKLNKRIKAINNIGDYNRFYCTEYCKQECPIFNKSKYYHGQENQNSREVQPELRQLVFERDNWTCQRCGSQCSLHCHHIDPVKNNPIESADIDVCITFCKDCHKWVHMEIERCGYRELVNC